MPSENYCPLSVEDVFERRDMEIIQSALGDYSGERWMEARIALSKVACCLNYMKAEEKLNRIKNGKKTPRKVKELEKEGCCRDTEQ